MTEPALTATGKAELLADYFGRFSLPVVIETGIWNGHGSTFQFSDRARVIATELDPERAALAAERNPNVEVHQGDSAALLPGILAGIDSPVLFWLDAHLVSEADEPNHSPLIAELDAILAWPHAAQSVVLIDDVRMMDREGWPTAQEVFEFLPISTPGIKCVWDWDLRDDVIRLTPS